MDADNRTNGKRHKKGKSLKLSLWADCYRKLTDVFFNEYHSAFAGRSCNLIILCLHFGLLLHDDNWDISLKLRISASAITLLVAKCKS